MASQVFSVLVEAKNNSREAFQAVQADAKLTTEQIKQLFSAGAAERARLLEDFQKTSAAVKSVDDAVKQAAESTTVWTDKQQRAAMAMEGMHAQALKVNEAFDQNRESAGGFGAELLKMVGLGAAAGGGMALVTTALGVLKEATIGGIQQFVEFGHSIELLHEKLNIPYEMAAAWQQTETVTGVSAEKMVNSLAMMDQRLEEGNKKAIHAVEELGLSVADLTDADPARQIELISEGLKHLEENGGNAAVAIKELMGRGGLSMLPALTPEAAALREEIEKINGPLEEQVKSAQLYAEQAALLEAHWAKIRRSIADPVVGGLTAFLAQYNKQGISSLVVPFYGGDTPGNPNSNVTSTITNPNEDHYFKESEEEQRKYLQAVMENRTIEEREAAKHAAEMKRIDDARKKELEDSYSQLEKDGRAFIRSWIQRQKEEEANERAHIRQEIYDENEHANDLRITSDQVVQIIAARFKAEEGLRKNHLADLKKYGGEIASTLHEIGTLIGGVAGSILTNVGNAINTAAATAAAQLKTNTAKLVASIQEAVTIAAQGYSLGRQVGSPAKGALAGAASGAAAGALFGSAVPGIGTAAGAIVGGVIGGVAGWIGGDKAQKEQKAQMEQMRQQLMLTYGTMQALSRVSSQFGIDIAKAFSTKNPQEFQKIVNQLNQALAEQQKRMQGLATAMDGLNLMAQALTSTMTRNKTATDGDQAAFKRLGDYAAATFGAMLKETGDVIGSLQRMEPTLAILAGDITQFGLQGSAALQELLGLRQIVIDNADIAQSIQGLTMLMKGLGEAGVTNSALFQGFGKDLVGDFDALVAKGVPANQALILMQPSLQQLWEHQQKFHDITDEATLALLHQGEEQGLVGENMKSVNEKVLDVLVAIAKVLKADIPDGLAALDGKKANINVNTNYSHSGDPPGGGKFGWNDDGTPDNDGDKSNSYGGGGYVAYRPGGQRAIISERVGETVLPDDYIGRLAAKIANAGGAGGRSVIENRIYLDGVELRKWITRQQDLGFLN